MTLRFFAAAGFAAISLMAAPVFAQESRFYISGMIGQGDYKLTGEDLGLSASIDKRDTAFGFAFGYQVSNQLAVEIGYADFGKAKFTEQRRVNSLPGCTISNPCPPLITGDGSAKAAHLSALLSAPLGDAISIYGRLGVADTDRSVSASAGNVSLRDGDKKTELLYGIGAAYQFNRNIAATLEWRKLNDTEASAALIGVRLNF
ncbi:MAG: outer membrane beta-barrel protein [Betaproteobacteria bacterium]|nr:outer membrane beta-barrel protein [Betaproteobacteria bacterium]